MKIKLPYVIVAAVLQGIVVFGANAQNPMPEAYRALSFTMTPVRRNVLLLEPVALQFGITNPSDREQNLKGDISLWTLKLYITKPNGEVITPLQLTAIPGGPSWMQQHISKVEPGAKRTWVETLEVRLDEYFGEVGEYQLRATYDNGKSLLTTEWTTLVVEQPQGEDLSAYERLRTLPFSEGVYTFSTRERQNAFIGQFPTSRYSDYVRYFAAQAYVGKNDEKAMEYFRAVEGKSDFVFATDAKKRLKELEKKTDN